MSDVKGRYILTLPLKTEVYQEHILEKRFRLGEHLYNNFLNFEKKKFYEMTKRKDYRDAQNLIKELTIQINSLDEFKESKQLIQELRKQRKEQYDIIYNIKKMFDWSEFGFTNDMKKYGDKYMFLTEKELKDAFWKSYNNKGRAVKWQFECPVREGNTDLMTLEKYQENWQINAFEFKLTDIKKVLLQAEGNLPYCNKSWIVIPEEKKDVILNRYMNYLNEKKYIGVIGVQAGGRYTIIFQPKFKQDMTFSQKILNMCMAEV